MRSVFLPFGLSAFRAFAILALPGHPKFAKRRDTSSQKSLALIACSLVRRHRKLHLLAQPLTKEQKPRLNLFVEIVPVR
jgi:hypothetical protein